MEHADDDGLSFCQSTRQHRARLPLGSGSTRNRLCRIVGKPGCSREKYNEEVVRLPRFVKTAVYELTLAALREAVERARKIREARRAAR